MQNQSPILYSFRRCPYAMRARLAISVSGQQVELREILLRDKPACMIEASPKGTVPVLITGDGTIIDESLEVMQWALSRHDPADWLLVGKKAKATTMTQCLISDNDGDFKHHLDRYKYATRYDGADPVTHRRQACKFLDRLEVCLASQPYLLGSHMTMADAAILPFIRQFAGADAHWFALSPYPGVRRWLDAFLASSLFKGIMQKHKVWQADDAPLYFPGQEKTLQTPTPSGQP